MNKYIENYGKLFFERYDSNDSTAVILSPDSPYSYEARFLSVNADNANHFKSNSFFNVDVNNFPEAEKILQDNDIAHPTGYSTTSGWCTYPVYELTDEAFEEFDRQINKYED